VPLPERTDARLVDAIQANPSSTVRGGSRWAAPDHDPREGLRAGDRLNRDFTANAPNSRWVADFTNCRTWTGSFMSHWASTPPRRSRSSTSTAQFYFWAADVTGVVILPEGSEMVMPVTSPR
jgi:hypothetical protein